MLNFFDLSISISYPTIEIDLVKDYKLPALWRFDKMVLEVGISFRRFEYEYDPKN